MADPINTTAAAPLSSSKSQITPQGKSSGSNTFIDHVKNMGKETIEASRASDEATKAAVMGQISDLELVQVMSEAELSLQRFKTVYETTKQSLDKVLNMNI